MSRPGCWRSRSPRSLRNTDLLSLDTASVDSLVRVSAPSADEADSDAAALSDIWVFNSQARLAGSSQDARQITRNEIVPARQVMESGAVTLVQALPDGEYAATAAIRAPDGSALGAVRVEFTSNQIGTHFELYQTEYLIGVVVILAALVLGSWFMAKRLARPIGLMVEAARAVEVGRQPEPGVAASLRNTSLTRDEYGELAGVFLDMAREVARGRFGSTRWWGNARSSSRRKTGRWRPRSARFATTWRWRTRCRRRWSRRTCRRIPGPALRRL